jgi:transposase-like protein
MGCLHCESGDTEERRERTALGCRHFRCRACQREFNARTGTSFNISEEKCLKRALASYNFTNSRTRLQRFARKTLCFSRSCGMHALTIGVDLNWVECGHPI